MAFPANTVWKGRFRQNNGADYEMILEVNNVANGLFQATLTFPTLVSPNGEVAIARMNQGTLNPSHTNMAGWAHRVSGSAFDEAIYQARIVGQQMNGVCMVGFSQEGTFQLNF